MKRVVSLFLPTWPTDRFYRNRSALLHDGQAPDASVRTSERDRPLVLIGSDGRSKVIHAANIAARRAGISVGMAATQAQALVPNLDTHLATPEDDIIALERLGLWIIRRYSPSVAIDPPDGLVIDATGSAHLFGGEAAMLEDLVKRLGSSSIAARAGLASSWGAAHASARHMPARTTIIPSDATPATLGPLPLSALRLTGDVVQQLRRLGFQTISDLNNTPRAPLTLRFGPSLLLRVDQAYGRKPEPFIPLEPPELPRVTRNFAEPISAPETLHRYTEKLGSELAQALEAKVIGASQIDLLFFRIDGRTEVIRAGLAQPSREARRLTRLLTDRIETIDPGPGVERMMLVASRTDTLNPLPGAALGEAPVRDISELIDTLSNRIGEDRLYRLAAAESDIPERSVTRIPPLSSPTDLRWNVQWPRPSRLLAPPEHIETVALLPDNPPIQFTWRGQRRRIKRADGPERIHGEWIRSKDELFSVRDYFVVEDEAGERFWLFRAGDGEDLRTGDQRWYLHGLFG
jgi:protein ImuB